MDTAVWGKLRYDLLRAPTGRKDVSVPQTCQGFTAGMSTDQLL